MTMRHPVAAAVIALMLIVTGVALWWVGIIWDRRAVPCRQRGAALDAKVEALKREAAENLMVGSGRAQVVRFFATHNIPLEFVGSVATGDIHTSGCAPFSCSSDEVLIGVRVEVDESGTVRSEPVVVSRYTSCF
jgi:hypothetical protein